MTASLEPGVPSRPASRRQVFAIAGWLVALIPVAALGFWLAIAAGAFATWGTLRPPPGTTRTPSLEFLFAGFLLALVAAVFVPIPAFAICRVASGPIGARAPMERPLVTWAMGLVAVWLVFWLDPGGVLTWLLD